MYEHHYVSIVYFVFYCSIRVLPIWCIKLDDDDYYFDIGVFA